MEQQWFIRQRPARLERRFLFQHYEQTRDFLERTARLSEREGYFPDISFGRTYVNVTIYGDAESEEVGAVRQRFASLMDDVLEACARSGKQGARVVSD